MASSYAALVSLNNIIHTILNHPNPPISLHPRQAQVLIQKITFLLEFLQLYSHREDCPTDDLEILIRETTYTGEDVIESYIVDQIAGSTSSCIKTSNHGDHDRFYQDLQKIVKEMGVIEQKAMEIKDKVGVDEDFQHMSLMPETSPVSPSLEHQIEWVGSDDVFNGILDKLTDQRPSRQIIPIVGMGGIGKTTLALKAFQHAIITYHFDIRVWVTISQKFSTREILLEIVTRGDKMIKETLSGMCEEDLGQRIHQTFSGMRYLIVMDDMWGVEAWDEVRRFLPDNCNGSRIIITSRISTVGLQLFGNFGSCGIELNLLDENESWSLLCKTVFREYDCPVELERIGKSIAKNCKGLPLSIVVVGGFLANSKQTEQHWEYVASNLSSVVNLEDNERCRRILYMSYKELPIHLKSCFLYMGIFPEDSIIRVSLVVKLLVAEGFLKPNKDNLMEAVAREYIKDLADRNLVLVHKQGFSRNIKSFKMHDLVRDVCVREAEKEKFYYVMDEDEHPIIPDYMSTQRRVVDQRRMTNLPYLPQTFDIQSATLKPPITRSFIRKYGADAFCTATNARLLRVLTGIDERYPVLQPGKILFSYTISDSCLLELFPD